MKSVNPQKYDLTYFNTFNQPDYSNYHYSLASKKYAEVSSLVDVHSTDLIVDLGCGHGDMCFYLSSKYHCKSIGIDYSKDAIKLANEHLTKINSKLKNKLNITFYNLDNQHLPSLSNVKYVFLNDVVEHLYEDEIRLIFSKISKWNDTVTVVVHTDNDIFLKFIRPFIDFFGQITGKYNQEYFLVRKKSEELHVNLTNPFKFNRVMSQLGFIQTKLDYPKVEIITIKKQLGLKNNSFILLPIKLILQTFKFLSPSFYAVYKTT